MKLKDVMMLAKCGVLGVLVATGLSAVAVEPDVVQLWEGGPYWATSNLGKSEVPEHPEYGALYRFDLANNAVKSLCGQEWRVPSSEDFDKLLASCVCSWDDARKGVVFTGRGDYSSNSVFFPVAGFETFEIPRSYVGAYGVYWSSTDGDYGNDNWDVFPMSLWLRVDAFEGFKGVNIESFRRENGCSVRAVRDTPPRPTITIDKVKMEDPWSTITVDYTLGGLISSTDYKVLFDVTLGGKTMSVTNDTERLTGGAKTKVIDTRALFGEQIQDANAKIKITLMTESGALQLWEGGPYWSTSNLGDSLSTDHPEFGALYQYEEADAAVKRLLGPEWRLPTKAEFDSLVSLCPWKRVGRLQGFMFNGIGNCSANSIYLPAAGRNYPGGPVENVGNGYYLTGDYPIDDFIYILYWDIFGHPAVDYMRPYGGFSVRAVQDTPIGRVATTEAGFWLWGPVEYVGADGTIQSRPAGGYEPLTAGTSTIGGGRWYVVMGTVSRGTITVDGSAHVILCDGAKLTVTGGAGESGIAVSSGKSLTIYGQKLGTGELVARGGADYAGIGNGALRSVGSVTINGGRVTAAGGHDGAGIGGSWTGSGGRVTINGGIVKATGGDGLVGIGGGRVSDRGVITINGGNVIASGLASVPKNSAGKPLHKVTFIAPEGVVPVFDGLDGYGLQGVVPVDGKFCFYLPDGSYEVSLGTATGPHGYYFFIVNGQDVVCNLQQFGLKVNGADVGNGSGSGWTYGNGILRLESSEVPYVLSGISTLGDVQVQVVSGCTVDLSDAIIYTQARPAFVVDNDVTATLRMKGGVSHLAATNAVGGASVSAIEVNGTLNVDFAPDADQTQSAIYAFNFGDQPAIGGSGEVSLIGGHLCAWSDNLAVSSNCTFQIDASSRGMMLGQVGDSWDDVRLVGDGYYLSESNFYEYSKLEVAPAYRVIIPASIDHVGRVTVSNSWQKLLHDSVGVSGALTNRYYAILDDTIVINCEVEGGYVMVGANPQIIPFLTNDVVVLPDVRTPLTITLPETLEGETYVVMEDGVEVDGEGEGASVYPVRSGYDIKIVCTAQEGWRIVSETNVVTFANIQESRVLTAADLPQAWRVFTVNVPAMANVAHELSTDDARMTIVADWETSSYAIISNAEVTVAFRGVGNYRVTANGTKTWTLTGDVVFGTTDGFPLPTVEGIPGTIVAPWTVGENVQAYTNIAGVLTITGTGAMSNFTNAADVPWNPAMVKSIAIGNEVTKIGVNTWFGMSGDVVVDGGLPLSRYAFVGEGFAASEEPSGSISPAEFERVDIVDGVALLGVSVYTSDAITNENWSVATNGVIEVPAPGKQGFFILKSKPSAPTDAPHAPIFIPEIIEE